MGTTQTRKRGLLIVFWALVVSLVVVVGVPSTARGAVEADSSSEAASSSSTNASDHTTNASNLEINSIDELIGKKFAVLNGSAFDTILQGSYEGISQKDFSYYNSNAELIQAVKTGKADAMIAARLLTGLVEHLTMIEPGVLTCTIG